MGISAGDAVVTITADSQQLDTLMGKLNNGLPNAASRASQAILDHAAKQAELRRLLQLTSTEAGRTAENMILLAQAEAKAAVAAAEKTRALKSLNSELGLTQARAHGAAEEVGLAGTAMEHFGKLLSAGFAIGFFEHLIEETQRSILELDHLSEKTGISIEVLAGLEHVTKAAGIGMEEMSTALVRLAKNQESAIEGGKAQVKAFNNIGISVDELKKLSPEELMYRVATGMQNATSHAVILNAAIGILGRGGAAVVPIFLKGGEALKSLVDEAAIASGVTEQAANSAKQWEQQTANLSQTFRSIMIPVMEESVPLLQKLEVLAYALGSGFKDLGVLGVVGFQNVATAASAAGQIAKAAATGNFASIPGIYKSTFDKIVANVNHGADEIAKNYVELQKKTESIFSGDAIVKAIRDNNNRLKDEDDKALQERIKAGVAEVKAREKIADEFLKVAVAEGKIELEQKKINLFEFLTLQQGAYAAELENHLKALDDENALLALDAKKNKEQITNNNAEKIALQLKYYEREKSDLAAALKEFNKLEDEAFKERLKHPLIVDVDKTVEQLAPVYAAFKAIQQAFIDLGIKSDDVLVKGVQRGVDAFNTLRADGVTSIAQIEQAEGKLLLLEIELANRGKDLIPVEGFITGAESAEELHKKLEVIVADLKKMGIEFEHTQKQSGSFLDKLNAQLKNGEKGMIQWGAVAENTLGIVTDAVGQAFEAWILGQDSLGHALRKALAQELAHIASLSLAWGLYWIARGIADLFWNPDAAADELTGGGELLALAAVFGASAYGINPKDGKGGGNQLAGTPIVTTGSQAPAPQQTVRHFAGGGIGNFGTLGLVSAPTLFIAGDSRSGGSQKEAIIPLEDEQATRAIAEKVMELNGGGGDIHVHVKGMVSSDNLRGIVRKMSKDIGGGKVRLTSSNSFRITRRG